MKLLWIDNLKFEEAIDNRIQDIKSKQRNCTHIVKGNYFVHTTKVDNHLQTQGATPVISDLNGRNSSKIENAEALDTTKEV